MTNNTTIEVTRAWFENLITLNVAALDSLKKHQITVPIEVIYLNGYIDSARALLK